MKTVDVRIRFKSIDNTIEWYDDSRHRYFPVGQSVDPSDDTMEAEECMVMMLLRAKGVWKKLVKGNKPLTLRLTVKKLAGDEARDDVKNYDVIVQCHNKAILYASFSEETMARAQEVWGQFYLGSLLNQGENEYPYFIKLIRQVTDYDVEPWNFCGVNIKEIVNDATQ